jgi:hypothetical protein
MRITYLTVFVVTFLTGWLYFALVSDFGQYEVGPTYSKAGPRLVKKSATLEETFARAFVLALGLTTLNTVVLWRWQKLRGLRHKTPSTPERPRFRESEHAA